MRQFISAIIALVLSINMGIAATTQQIVIVHDYNETLFGPTLKPLSVGAKQAVKQLNNENNYVIVPVQVPELDNHKLTALDEHLKAYKNSGDGIHGVILYLQSKEKIGRATDIAKKHGINNIVAIGNYNTSQDAYEIIENLKIPLVRYKADSIITLIKNELMLRGISDSELSESSVITEDDPNSPLVISLIKWEKKWWGEEKATEKDKKIAKETEDPSLQDLMNNSSGNKKNVFIATHNSCSWLAKAIEASNNQQNNVAVCIAPLNDCKKNPVMDSIESGFIDFAIATPTKRLGQLAVEMLFNKTESRGAQPTVLEQGDDCI